MLNFLLLPERFRQKVQIMPNGCWRWTGSISKGYGRYWDSEIRRKVQAHVFAYETLIGRIPEGKEPDHLCRNPDCVNPEHLEPVTHQVNLQRGINNTFAKSKTHCPKGHPYDDDNTYINSFGRRSCKVCRKERSRIWMKEHYQKVGGK